MKMKTFLLVCGIFVLLSCQAKESIRIYAYPASIYDDARCSVYQDFQKPAGSIPASQRSIDARHSNGANVLVFDGSVAHLKIKDITSANAYHFRPVRDNTASTPIWVH